jgi:very-short-patch-repair endonuclease
MAMVEYVVFFGLILVGIVFFVLDLRRPQSQTQTISVDQERLKCESPIERRLYDALQLRGYYVQTQVPCGKYRIDLALPAYKIAIECDGRSYHSSPEQKAHDRRKNAYLRKNGWKVLRFSGRMIYRDLPKVIARIEKEVNG